MEYVSVSFDGHESVETRDPGSLLFGDDVDDGSSDDHGFLPPASRQAVRLAHRRKLRRRRQLFGMIGALLVVALVAASYVAFRTLYAPKDWAGPGSGTVTVQVHSGDGADAIASTLVKQGVVRSSGAFTKAAAANSKSGSIQAGFYKLRKHMSGVSALNLMLDPSSHIVNKLTIPEGTIDKDVITKLAAALKVSDAQVQSAAADIESLGLPDGYGSPKSAEGFLFPDTYQLDPGMSPTDALQMMTSEFTTQDKANGFADGAKKLGLSPYQALIIASMAQSEVKYDSDAPKVVRVILNRLATGMPLQVDAASVYGAKVAGLDPAKVDFSKLDSPYNTYLHNGLPPTPISNPGQSALTAAVSPAAGKWLFYVNIDTDGHLGFFENAADFQAAAAKCA